MTEAHTTISFIEQANIVHNHTYDYDEVSYKHDNMKITVTCRTHGPYTVSPHNHLMGRGCPKCSKDTTWMRNSFKDKCTKNNNGLGILYIIGCWDDDKSEVFIKIGITSRSIKRRYCSKAKMPYNYKILHEIQGNPEYIFDLETKLIKKSKHYLYTPKTVFGGSSTECFEADRDYLKKLNTYVSELIPF